MIAHVIAHVILDTNALSALADGDPQASAIARNAEVLMVPVIALGEYRFGIAQSRHAHAHERWLSGFLGTCGVVPVDEQTTRIYAEVRTGLRQAGTPIPANDAWIAALCLQYGMAVMSRDRHFDLVQGLRRVGW